MCGVGVVLMVVRFMGGEEMEDLVMFGVRVVVFDENIDDCLGFCLFCVEIELDFRVVVLLLFCIVVFFWRSCIK